MASGATTCFQLLAIVIAAFALSTRPSAASVNICCQVLTNDQPSYCVNVLSASQCTVLSDDANSTKALVTVDSTCSADNQPGSQCQVVPSGLGDPVFTGFDGAEFLFEGAPNAFYNVLSEQNHQITALFTPANLPDNNSTYITAFGVKYRHQQVRVEVQEDASLIVELNGERLTMEEGEYSKLLNVMENSERDGTPQLMQLSWELYRHELGFTVDITTPMLQFIIYSVPAGPNQPPYLNSQAHMRAEPESDMQGVLGQTYQLAVAAAKEGDKVTDLVASENTMRTTASVISGDAAIPVIGQEPQEAAAVATHRRSLKQRSVHQRFQVVVRQMSASIGAK